MKGPPCAVQDCYLGNENPQGEVVLVRDPTIQLQRGDIEE